MQWLNKVDDAIDWVLGPVEGDDGGADNDEIARAAAEAIQQSSTSSDDVAATNSVADNGPSTKDTSVRASSKDGHTNKTLKTYEKVFSNTKSYKFKNPNKMFR